jgi:uncharacterized protein
MKKAFIISLCMVACLLQTLNAQVKKPATPAVKKPAAKTTGPKLPPPIKADPNLSASKIYSIARATKTGILIRWAPDNEGAWSLGNRYGYGIERYTILRDGKVLSATEKKASKFVFKPRPLQEWDSLANNNDYAAVLAQAIYGEDFDVEVSDKSGVAQMVNQTQQLTQRFNMSMYAADQSFEAAQYGGLAWHDKEVKANEKYFYRVYSLIPRTIRKTDTALLYIGPGDYEPLPKPSVILPEFSDKTAILKWDFDGFKEFYSSYIIERSSDNGASFQRVSDKPVTKLNETDPKSATGSMLYIDALPGNDTVYQYRIAGISLFGETGPYSDVASGKGMTELPLTPHITHASIAENGNYQLNWEFEDSLNGAVREFQINQAATIQGPYTTQKSGLTGDLRITEIDALYSSNYYTITVIPKEGSPRTSLPYLLQPEDSIPPAIPADVEATIDSAGIVLVKWKANTENDLAGYKILKANVKGHEFTPLMDSIWQTNEFRDTVNLKNLNQKLYYVVRAVDSRHNQSEFSKVIEVVKPDIIPPTSPVLSAYEVMESGVRLQWVNSSDEDVAVHKLYRRLLSDTISSWALLQEFTDQRTEYIDKECAEGATYSYTVVAADKGRLESAPAIPLTIAVPEKRVKTGVKKLDALVDRTARSITLNWIQAVDTKIIRRFELFRAQDKQPMSLYKQLDIRDLTFIDTDLQVNSRYQYAIRVVYTNGKYSDFVTKQVIY